MDVILKRHVQPEPERRKPDGLPPAYRIGEKGRVKDHHSEDNTVDVILDTGVFLKHVPVRSNEWVVYGEDSEKDYNAGGRDLPPLHSRVFVLMPTGYDDCFVLCSLFSTPSQAEPFLADDRERIKEIITPGGWHIANDNDTGSHKSISPDKKTSLEIDYGSKEEPKDKPELHLNLFGEIKADATAGDNVALKVFDADILINKNGDVVIKTKGSVSTKAEGKFYIGNESQDICALLLALTDELINFQTFGPPPQHKTHPETVTKLNLYKEKIKTLFTESA
jgi:hypothetical protein